MHLAISDNARATVECTVTSERMFKNPKCHEFSMLLYISRTTDALQDTSIIGFKLTPAQGC